MSYKILEANGVDNENIDGGALNNLIVKDKNGIVNGVLSECALTATGSLIGISPGLLILHGIRVKITATETLTLANVPATATKYQIVAQVVLSTDRSVSFCFLVQEPIALKQDELYATNEGTYQIEFGTFTQNTDGTISGLVRTVGTLYESETQMREDLNDALADIATLKTDVDGNEKGVAENVALIANNARNIAQNSAHIQNLYAIARENNQFAVFTTEQAYTTRQTADGAEIFDEQYTAVTEIKGSTVKTINKYNLTEAKNDTNPGAGTKITVLENGFLVVGKESDIPYESSCANGWFRAGGTKLKVLPIVKTGDKLNVSVDITLVEDENKLSIAEAFAQYPNAGKIGCFISDANGNIASGSNLALKNTTAKQTIKFSRTITEVINGKAVFLIINLGSFTMKIENIMVTINEDLPRSFVPYFSDLKHANIKSIKSTGRNLFDKSKAKDGYEIGVGATGAEHVNAEWFVTNLIPVLPNTRYAITGKPNGTAATEYDANKKAIGSAQGNSTSYIYTSSNARFVKLNGKLADKDTFQLEKGSTASEYEPYVDDIYELPETLKLCEYDSFNPQTGEITRQTETITFDGSSDERWVSMSGNYPYVYCKLVDLGYVINDACIASRYEHNSSINVSTSGTGYRVVNSTSGGEARIIVRPSSDYDFSSLDTWLAELQSNPLTVSYKLATPTIEKIKDAPKLYKAWKHGSETVVQGETDNSAYGAMPTITNEYFTAVGAGEEEANE